MLVERITLNVPSARAEPIIARAPRRAPLEATFRAHDDAELFHRHWPAREHPRRGAIILLHRGHEHSGRMAHLVDELDLPGFAFHALDARGHGRSIGAARAGVAGMVRDLDGFVAHVAAQEGIAIEDIAVIGHSLGGAVAAIWAHDHAPKLRALVLAAPAFDIRLFVPGAWAGLRLLRRLRGNFAVRSYVRPRMLTRDRARIRAYKADPLITPGIAVDDLLDLRAASARVVADASAIAVPTQVLVAGDDWVVRPGAQHRFFDGLGATFKQRHAFAGLRHDILGERDRAPAIARVRSFLLARFAAAPEHADLRDADRRGPTRDEATALAAPLPPLSARGLYWRATRAAIRLGALLSDGLALGRRTGFDSGSTLDYVYRDRATGVGPIGRAIDRAYLDSIGWRGIRQRKVHVEQMIHDAAARLRGTDQPVRIMDIAAGHGRYVLDAVAAMDQAPASILLRDASALNQVAGERLIAERGLGAIARFQLGDAFDRHDLASVEPRPTLAIVSGLYELFAANDLVRLSLRGLADAIAPGGYLIYTNQPWHPQLELIARALTNHRDGRAWVMRRRTQAEMDQLVENAGFRKLDQRIDRWGIFTVSLAERVA